MCGCTGLASLGPHRPVGPVGLLQHQRTAGTLASAPSFGWWEGVGLLLKLWPVDASRWLSLVLVSLERTQAAGSPFGWAEGAPEEQGCTQTCSAWRR